jgi:anaerobic selenocysteine-containing dehydrogenase
MMPAAVLQHRILEPYAMIHPQTAAPLGVEQGMEIQVSLSGSQMVVAAHLDETIPQEVVLVPRSMGVPVHGPTPVTIEIVQRTVA